MTDKLKILIVNDPGCPYQRVMLDHYANNELVDVVVVPREEYYNVGTPGHIDHGKEELMLIDRVWLTREDIEESFYGKSIAEIIADAGVMLDAKELPVDYMLELRDCDPPPVDIVKPNKPWYRQGEKSW